eukprot:1157679-Pelagomonas_calceolata.AAC.7
MAKANSTLQVTAPPTSFRSGIAEGECKGTQHPLLQLNCPCRQYCSPPCAACSHSSLSVALLACVPVVAAVKGSAAERLQRSCRGAAAEGKAGQVPGIVVYSYIKPSQNIYFHDQAQPRTQGSSGGYKGFRGCPEDTS